MLQIEVIKDKTDADDGVYEVSHLSVNGVTDWDSSYVSGDYGISVNLRNEEVIDMLIANSPRDLSKHFDDITFFSMVKGWDTDVELLLLLGQHYKAIRIRLVYKTGDWKNIYSIADLSATFTKIIDETSSKNMRHWERDNTVNQHPYLDFGVEYKVTDWDTPFESSIKEALESTASILDLARKKLIEEIDPKTITRVFNFPEEISIACQQYLIYFTQFLADLGIKVNSQLEYSNFDTIFKVSPTDPIQALDEIKNALEIYLKAPAIRYLPSHTTNNDTAVVQWDAEIQRLRSSLDVALATIEYKNASIEHKDTTIKLLNLINFEMQNSNTQNKLQDSEKGKEEQEFVISNAVSVGKFEIYGFTFHLNNIIKRLKRTFGKIRE